MPANSTNQGIDRRRLTIREAASYAGVSTDTIRRRINDGTLPAVRLGGKGPHQLDSADLDALWYPVTPSGDAA